MSWLTTLFQALMATEEAVLPVFVHNPESQKIVAVIMMAESAIASAFGLTTLSPPTTAQSVTVTASIKKTP